jgi:hypothetical protein
MYVMLFFFIFFHFYISYMPCRLCYFSLSCIFLLHFLLVMIRYWHVCYVTLLYHLYLSYIASMSLFIDADMYVMFLFSIIYILCYMLYISTWIANVYVILTFIISFFIFNFIQVIMKQCLHRCFVSFFFIYFLFYISSTLSWINVGIYVMFLFFFLPFLF